VGIVMLSRVFVVVVLSLWAVTAHAGDQATAREAFARGQVLHRQGEFAAALAQFREAARQIKHPNVTLNMAQCHRNLRNARKAVFFYKLYISQWTRTYPGKPVPHEAEARGHIRALEAEIKKARTAAARRVKPGLIKISGTLVDRAQVLVDDAPRGVWPMSRPMVVKPGKREVRVEATGYLTWRGAVEVKAGQTAEVTVSLHQIPQRRRSRVWLAVWISALALAGGMEAMGIAYQVEANKHFEETPDHLQARDASVAGHVAAGVLGAAAVAGFVLWLNSGKVESAPAGATLAPTTGGAIATWTVRF
jgi:hypothetical protein